VTQQMNPAAEQFVLDDPEIQKDPYPFYPILRDQAPVLKTSFGGQPCWVLSRREDIATVLMDPKIFSSHTSPSSNLVHADPPDHSRLRKLVARMFTRRAVSAMAEHIAQTTEELVDQIVRKGRCDIVADFAGPLTVSVIGRFLGIATGEVERMRHLTHLAQDYEGSIRLNREPSPESQTARQDLTQLAADIVRLRQFDTGGVVASLVGFVDQGDLTELECVNLLVLLIIAGHATTTNLLANSIYMLTQRPDDLTKLRDDKSAIAPYVEEVLRTRPSFHRITRITTEPVTLSGTEIPAGSIVRLLLASANRDPSDVESPEVFDPAREQGMHLAFGYGIHTCLGQWLARLESETALEVFARRVSTVGLIPDESLIRFSGGTFNEFGFECLPVRLSAVRPVEAN